MPASLSKERWVLVARHIPAPVYCVLKITVLKEPPVPTPTQTERVGTLPAAGTGPRPA